jgi:hypothetical protein
MLTRTFSEPQLSPLWRLAHWAYRSSTDLLMVRSGEIVDSILSAEGLRQGDPLSSLLFCFTVLPGYSSTVNSAPGLHAVAIVDDFNLSGPHTSLLTAFDHLAVNASTFGLVLGVLSAYFFGLILHLFPRLSLLGVLLAVLP